MKRAFVTGGSGFLGGRLIEILVARGVEVVALARSDASAKKVEARGARAIKGDLENVAAMTDGMKGCDVVFHAAAHTEQYDPLEVHIRITVRGTENVIEAARAAHVPRFVHVSTEAVLADGKPIVRADEARPLPMRPLGEYPITKGMAERAVIAANSTDLATVIVRPRFIWGKGDTNVLQNFVSAVKAGSYAWIDGGRYLTSTCHVDNVVEGMILAAERGTPGAIYFLTDGAPIELRAFVTDMLASQGLDPGTRSVPHWAAHALVMLTAWMKRPPLTRTAFALMAHEVTVDDTKARRELGYVGAKTRSEGLAEMHPAAGGV